MINPRDYAPPSVDRRPPPPPPPPPATVEPARIRHFIDTDGHPSMAIEPTTELEAVAAGLDPEQEIRAEALRVAAALLRNAEPPMTSRFVVGYAGMLADWIRTGVTPR